MAVRFRLARHGRSGRPFYWLVLCNSTSSRDGKFLKKLGTYDPFISSGPKLQITDENAVRHYLSCGAKPSDTVARLFKTVNIDV